MMSNKMDEASFQTKKLKCVYKDFDTNLKTERIQGNVFVKKEVYVTLVYFCQKTIPLF